MRPLATPLALAGLRSLVQCRLALGRRPSGFLALPGLLEASAPHHLFDSCGCSHFCLASCVPGSLKQR